MFYNQFEHYKEKGGRRESQIEYYRNPSISIHEFRELTDTLNDYARFQKPRVQSNKRTHKRNK